jgi:hypothetical protein
MQPLQRGFPPAGLEHAAAATTIPADRSIQSSHFWMLSHYFRGNASAISSALRKSRVLGDRMKGQTTPGSIMLSGRVP